MPIIGGGASGGSGAASTLFSSTLSAPAASFDIVGISAAFSVLQLYGLLRDDAVDAFVGNALIRFNNDSGANYAWQLLRGANVTASASINDAANSGIGLFEADASVAASVFGAGRVSIPFYANTATFKTAHTEGGSLGTAANDDARVTAFMWKSTAAINRITVLPGAGANFVAGSALLLVGMV